MLAKLDRREPERDEPATEPAVDGVGIPQMRAQHDIYVYFLLTRGGV